MLNTHNVLPILLAVLVTLVWSGVHASPAEAGFHSINVIQDEMTDADPSSAGEVPSKNESLHNHCTFSCVLTPNTSAAADLKWHLVKRWISDLELEKVYSLRLKRPPRPGV